MTQEDRELLIKDLCGRLPYHVKIHSWDGKLIVSDLNTFPFSTELMYEEDMWDQLSGFKPYLRPMSSMTEEEKREVSKLGVCDDGAFHNDIYDVGTSMEEAFTAISWFLERHFDINYLIEKGLALEAPEEMYKTD